MLLNTFQSQNRGGRAITAHNIDKELILLIRKVIVLNLMKGKEASLCFLVEKSIVNIPLSALPRLSTGQQYPVP